LVGWPTTGNCNSDANRGQTAAAKQANHQSHRNGDEAGGRRDARGTGREDGPNGRWLAQL